MTADFVTDVLQELHLVPCVGREAVLAEEAVMTELGAIGNVLRRNEVCDRNAGLFGDGSQVNEVVGIAVVEGNSHGRNLDRTFSDQFDRLAQPDYAKVPKQIIHLAKKI